MHADADHELLRRYADHGSDEAFTELVRRHINLVWSAARRVSGDTELARDVAQRHLALAVRMYFGDHQQRLPTKLEELHAYLKDTLGTDGTVKGVSLDLLEFHDHEREVAGFEPRLILMRERHARRLPDGTWERIYSLMDGSVQRVKRANGDFSDFELAGTATVANAPTPR
jgi:hypothetical protein